ncbi:MAG TPA: hypothetical protein VK745_19485 [Polyangiaceae bacterium]|nr:hypothetical protein [Polyangiaceae bacterium]
MASRTFRYLLAVLAVAALYLACCTRADARPPFWRSRPSPPPYSFTVEDENGNALPTFQKDGRSYLLGEPGLRYNIRVQNPTAQRIEAVVSVDGRDAVSGDPGDYVNGRGYVIAPYGSVLVEGFRRSLEEVATFRFTSPEDSYSARMGTPQNVGVIGVAFFPERARQPEPVVRRRVPQPAPYHQYSPRFDAQGARSEPSAPSPAMKQPRASAPASGASAGGASTRDSSPRREAAKAAPRDEFERGGSVNNLGTEFGETRESVVGSVSFERASQMHPALVVTLRYDDADGLSARGIDLSALGYSGRSPASDEPQAFPVSHFARPPP